MASATEIGPFFATLRHAPILLPEELLTMVLLLLRDSTSAAADADARSLYAGLMGGIGSVCRSWRRLVKGVLMGDELAWLRVQVAPHCRRRRGRRDCFGAGIGIGGTACNYKQQRGA